MTLGVLALAALPAAVALAEVREEVKLLHAAAAIPVAALVGVLAVALATGAARQVQLTLGRVGGERLARAGRALGLFALYVATTAALALGFFGLLKLFE